MINLYVVKKGEHICAIFFCFSIEIWTQLTMSCKQCSRGPHRSMNYAPQYYPECEEPVAPTLSLGNRILWLTDTFAASGIVRWIGRIPSVSAGWTAGVEFDNAMRGGGSGDFQNRSFFRSRPGHSLFLPLQQLIQVDSADRHSEPSFFGRLQNSCSNLAQRRRRDSTFGHFKHECHFTCAQNEFHCSSHAPVYDRITSRRSLLFKELPYETCDMPGDNDSPPPQNCLRVKRDSSTHHKGHPEERLSRNESIFHPSLRFISGLKEWVSCLLQGTTRRKGQLVLRDRKSVASFFLAPHSLTGQRLSSFSEYASVTAARQHRSNTQSHNSWRKASDLGEERERPHLNSGNPLVHQRKQASKKRPAPLPPRQVEGDSTERNVVVQGSSKSLSRRSSIKKKYKKKRAPLPPSNSSVYATVCKKDFQNVPSSSNYASLHFLPAKHQTDGMVLPENQHHPKHLTKHIHKPLHRPLNPDISALVNSNHRCSLVESEDSSSGSFSPDESGDEKYGLVKYCLAKDRESPSEFVRYSGNKDVRLKISIQKTETNVVTVEEVSSPQAAHYTIEEDTSSSSELSDELPCVSANSKKITFPSELTDECTESSPAEEDKPKTIFDALQLEPPVKRSVKDFVHAFNMLATQDQLSNGSSTQPKKIQSFPTKWEFQNSKSFPANPLLLPIAEESIGEDEIAEDHRQERSTKEHKGGGSSGRWKEDAPGKRAHLAALSSLLKECPTHETHEGSLKLGSKLEQPIMVGLYIEDKSSHRGPMPLLVTPSMSLSKLKKQVEEEYDVPRQQQCWILGQSFAVRDEAPLSSYGVQETGCPVLLYVMSSTTRAHSLPGRGGQRRKEDGKLGQATMRKISHELKGRSKEQKQSKYHREWEVEYEKKADYRSLLALDDVDLVANIEEFECPVCFLPIGAGEGVVLQDCLHSFCRECLVSSIQYSDTAIIQCPFANEEYSCESHLQEREIKCLVTPEIYEKHLARSVALAESQARDSFHCKTPDCPGWCLFEDRVNTFACPVCKKTNCLTCAAVHEGRNCRQYQDWLALQSDTSEEARKTREYLREMVEGGEAMECPVCQVILMKKWGCDWLKCSMCHSEVCWVTKGPRWGPGGRGDTSGGCKCMMNGVRCHPKCSYCH